MMPYVFEILIAVISGSLIFLIENIMRENKQLKESKKENEKAIIDGVMTLLKIQIIEYHEKYMNNGRIPSYVYDNFDEMYTAYKNLGGNGMIRRMKEEIDGLRVNSD